MFPDQSGYIVKANTGELVVSGVLQFSSGSEYTRSQLEASAAQKESFFARKIAVSADSGCAMPIQPARAMEFAPRPVFIGVSAFLYCAPFTYSLCNSLVYEHNGVLEHNS